MKKKDFSLIKKDATTYKSHVYVEFALRTLDKEEERREKYTGMMESLKKSVDLKRVRMISKTHCPVRTTTQLWKPRCKEQNPITPKKENFIALQLPPNNNY